MGDRSNRNFFGPTSGGGGLAITSGGYFFGVGVQIGTVNGTATIISPTGVNNVLAFLFFIPYSIVISHITFAKGAVNVAGATANFGIYDSTGKLLIDSGAFDCSAGGASFQVKTIAAVTLPAGVYYFAQGATDSTVTCQTQCIGYGATGNQVLIQNAARSGIAANPLAAGALPATLGAIAATSNRSPVGVLFEP